MGFEADTIPDITEDNDLTTKKYVDTILNADDTIIVVDNKIKFLKDMPLIRQKILECEVKLNENKFYLQHYSKKVPFWHMKLKNVMLQRQNELFII